jgi:hypothetical protein
LAGAVVQGNSALLSNEVLEQAADRIQRKRRGVRGAASEADDLRAAGHGEKSSNLRRRHTAGALGISTDVRVERGRRHTTNGNRDAGSDPFIYGRHGAWLSSAVVDVSGSRRNPLRMLVLFLAAAGVGLVVSLLMPVPVAVSGTSVIDRSGG